jgi:hypothetical protein
MPDTGPGMVAPDDPRALIWDLIAGPWRFAAVHALAALDCADHLAAGPLSTAELASCCGADTGALGRLLAWAASAGLLHLTGTGRWTLTAAGHTLRADVLGSMRAAVLATGDPAAGKAMTSLEHTVRTGQPAFGAEHGCGFYDYLAAHPAAGRTFQEFMTSRSADLATAIAALDFTGAQVVADIGGGHGSVLASVLTAWPHLRGILADHPAVLDGARELLTAAGVLSRMHLIGCDYRDPAQIPAADTYLLASILHNHDDCEARAILAGIMAGATGLPRVILAEILLPGGPGPHFGYDLDIRMMALGVGRERTRTAYLTLLSDAGLTSATVTSTPGAFSIVDAQPAVGTAMSRAIPSPAFPWSDGQDGRPTPG